MSVTESQLVGDDPQTPAEAAGVILRRNPGVDHGFAVTRPGPEVAEFHHKLPGYRDTPLHDLPDLAAQLGVARVIVKDESTRLELPSFKMLGASWATYTALVEHTGIDPEGWSDLSELAERLQSHLPLTLAAATDGNHGRAVARMARLLGLTARIWVPMTWPRRVLTPSHRRVPR